MSRLSVISALELAKVSYPGARVTSGAARGYLARLDRAFGKDRYRAQIEESPGGFRVVSLDESTVCNIPAEALPRVERRRLTGGAA